MLRSPLQARDAFGAEAYTVDIWSVRVGQFSFQPEESQPPKRQPSQSALRLDPMKDAHQNILEYLKTWLARHPAPDQPVLSVANLGAYSPRELCEAMEKRTEAGQFLETLILFGASSHPKNGLLDVLQSFVLENDGPADKIDRLMIETPK